MTMVLNRIKKQKTKVLFTTEQFYIYSNKSETNWQFRDRENHVAISTSSSLEGLKTCISRFLIRYKDYNHYEKALKGLSEPAVSSKVREVRIKEYNKQGDKYIDILEDLIQSFNNELVFRENSKRRPLPSPTLLAERFKDLENESVKDIPQVNPEPRRLLKRRKSRL